MLAVAKFFRNLQPIALLKVDRFCLGGPCDGHPKLVLCVSSEDCQARQIASGADGFVLELGDVAVVSMPIISTAFSTVG